jgi:hypothetical protein
LVDGKEEDMGKTKSEGRRERMHVGEEEWMKTRKSGLRKRR